MFIHWDKHEQKSPTNCPFLMIDGTGYTVGERVSSMQMPTSNEIGMLALQTREMRNVTF